MKNPTDLPLAARSFAEAHDLLPPGSAVLCALSGGADSMALLSVLLHLQDDLHFTVYAAHYNHGLRGAEAIRDETFVTEWCHKNAVPLTVGRGDVGVEAQKRKAGIEETARSLRYAFLTQTAKAVGATHIATAHNADDNAETVLLNLVRGTGLDGLTGIPPKRGCLVRPLLPCTRLEIETYLSALGIPHVEDSTNQDPAYSRNRVRQSVMPVLRSINPNFVDTLTANLNHLRADRDFLDRLAQEITQTATSDGDEWSLSAADLAAQPRPVAVRVLRQLLAKAGQHQISAVHLNALCALAESTAPGAFSPLPHGLFARREYDRLILSKHKPKQSTFSPVLCPTLGRYETGGGWTVILSEAIPPFTPTPYHCYLSRAAAEFPLTLRPRAEGDALRPIGRHTKPLKKWYIEQRIPQRMRDTLPVLTDKTTILAAAGVGTADHCAPQPGSPTLSVSFLPIEPKNL